VIQYLENIPNAARHKKLRDYLVTKLKKEFGQSVIYTEMEFLIAAG